MLTYIFPKNFIWGAITSSYQIEGAWNEDGKGESIWDRQSHTPEKMKNNVTGDIACDHYHRYQGDIKVMKELGLKSYSFSISWPRIFPTGRGQPNQKGIDFYKKLIDELVANNIKPCITLNHWDLPQKLQDIGGWANRDVTDYFQQYAELMFQNFGEMVPIWLTHSEPWIVAFFGYASKTKYSVAPGLNDFSTALLVSYNLLLSHGKAVQTYRKLGCKGEIGISLDIEHAYPVTKKVEDREATYRYDGHVHRWFLDPIFNGTFPQDILEWLEERVVMPTINEEDLKIINSPIDFLGVNYYSSNFIRYKDEWPLDFEEGKKGDLPTNSSGWEIYPEGLYDLLIRLDRDYNGVKIIITENGSCFTDSVTQTGEVIDDERLKFISMNLEQAHRAIKSGVNLAGYYVWSFIDNLEWQYGYEWRFGLVYIDYKTQARIIKKSGHWYRTVMQNNGF